ncbi:MerR family transcriptional regulator [Porphyrobacter sp. LM 6]|uniref:MerR family transcriptional regulator n=1 Tax=Porphyrobacter sp. LM 6 TaxID=1896196 RepID=UPI0008463B6F|nr:MerR family transcriptional regulator [Porphyrobacter sp. LM 6]AOL94579.1 transcriptional regulator, MerR family [Porphyrobacter sp. LM 6]
MKIGDFARAGGVNVETIRYYQRRGLLMEPPRKQGPRRYGSNDLDRLRSIRAAQMAGFTLDEISTLLELDTSDRSAAQALANSRIAALDEKIATLQTMRAALVRLAGACAAEEAGPCPIIAAFNPAANT